LIENINMVKDLVAAVNFTDNQSATPRMTSWACSQVAMDQNAEPVLQMSARNRSRGNVQSEIIGATALGVRNVLCVTGDSAKLSPAPRDNMQINDLDAIQMLWVLRRMRDEGKYLDGRPIKNPPMFECEVSGAAGAEKGQRGRTVLPNEFDLRCRRHGNLVE
jgi:methylenetetrahydrofolate reductase (NADPH)